MKSTFTCCRSAAGQFARIVVEQPAVDAVLVLLNPDGRPSAEVNNYPPPEPEYLSLMAETDRRLPIEDQRRRPQGGARKICDQSRRLARGHAP